MVSWFAFRFIVFVIVSVLALLAIPAVFVPEMVIGPPQKLFPLIFSNTPFPVRVRGSAGTVIPPWISSYPEFTVVPPVAVPSAEPF